LFIRRRPAARRSPSAPSATPALPSLWRHVIDREGDVGMLGANLVEHAPDQPMIIEAAPR
jgi:hypothetical protein